MCLPSSYLLGPRYGSLAAARQFGIKILPFSDSQLTISKDTVVHVALLHRAD